MAITDALSAATSGLTVNGSRVAATADNIANVHTKGYSRVEVHAKSIPPQFGGGVTGVVERERVSNIVEASEIAQTQGVDIATEFTTLIQAKTAYSANLKTLETAEEMLRESVDLAG